MMLIGLLLIGIAAAVGIDVAVENPGLIDVNAFGQVFSLSSGWTFVAGAIAGAIALLGLTMLMGGLARSRRRRLALHETRGNAEELAAERDRLRAELDRERADHAELEHQTDLAQAERDAAERTRADEPRAVDVRRTVGRRR